MTRYILIHILFVICFTVIFLFGFGCDRFGGIDDKLNLAENLMESHPDSSLSILKNLREDDIKGAQSRARYALLKTIALDKNYIDIKTFDILNPALEYYLKSGGVDEKRKTYYYQGIIHENAGNDDLAMQSYLNAIDIDVNFSDTLTFARLLVAQSTLYYKQYKIEAFIQNNLKAANLYQRMGRILNQLRCYSKALNGDIILRHKDEADSIANLCQEIIKKDSIVDRQIDQTMLMYTITFENSDMIRKTLIEVPEDAMTDVIKINLAQAYSKIGEPDTGLKYLNEASVSSDDILDSLTYCLVATDIYDKLGRDKDALESHKNYSRLLEQYHTRLFSNELLFSEKKHEMVIESMAKIQKRDRIIKWTVVGAAILMLLAILIYFRYRLNKAGRLLAEESAERLKLETEKLQLEAKNLELENERFKLETDNLHLQVSQLEEEKDRLENLLKKQSLLSDDARQLIRERINMLNGLFAKAITKEENYGKEFQKYVEKIKKDKKKFQQSIGKVMEGTHPEFMDYLREHGLTDREMNYVCLYAIGLRGKEIGSYLDLARHYNISTDIRRKLGLDSNGENLGPFIRKMMGQGG